MIGIDYIGSYKSNYHMITTALCNTVFAFKLFTKIKPCVVIFPKNYSLFYT